MFPYNFVPPHEDPPVSKDKPLADNPVTDSPKSADTATADSRQSDNRSAGKPAPAGRPRRSRKGPTSTADNPVTDNPVTDSRQATVDTPLPDSRQSNVETGLSSDPMTEYDKPTVEALSPLLRATAEIEDPLERFHALGRMLATLERTAQTARRVRHACIADLLDQGKGVTEIAKATGVSQSTVKTVRAGLHRVEDFPEE